MKKLFPTQEVGSLLRAPFLKKTISEREISETEYWGRLLCVPEYEKLVEILKTGKYVRDELYDWASIYGLRFFESAGLDVVWDGEQRRVEMYEYPLRNIEGAVFYGKVKVWDVETYNKAAIVSEPRLLNPIYLNEFLFAKRFASRELKIPVTGPYTLADWSFPEHHYAMHKNVKNIMERKRLARRDLVLDMAEKVLRPVIKKLSDAGAKRIQIDEPAATTNPEEMQLFVEAFNKVVTGIDARFTLHICYSDYRRLFPHVLEMKIDELSIECANRDTPYKGQDDEKRRGYLILKIFREYGVKFKVAPGVIDVHTDFIESPDLVSDRLLYSAKLLGDPSLVIACNDCGLRTRRWEVAYKKELSLVEGASLARSIWEKQ
ncbi:MAG: hypothetical protein QXI61_00645 [Nitrososphaerota archaeon]